ncbi:MAG: hypothetical protein ABJK28_07585 [Algibacter sp.]
MNFLKLVRKYSFWGYDFLRGGQLKKHYLDVKFILENYGSKESLSLREKYLRDLLEHAVKTSAYYKKTVVSSKFEDFPVINKNTVLNNFEDFKSSKYVNDANTKVSTNGSTGTPFKLFHNKNKRSRHDADNLYFAEKGGYSLGDRLYLLRAIHKKDFKSLLRFFRQNFKTFGILNYTDADIEKLLNDFKKGSSEKCIVCFASMCEIIVNYLDSNNVVPMDNPVKSIVTDGDKLSKSTKDKMEKYFGIPVFARYGNMECGVMGQQDKLSGHKYSLNWASYYFEVLDLKEDKPANPGEVGRIVVTDLFNHCMPLIRYDTGDLACFAKNEDKLIAPCFERIEGRVVDLIWDTKGNVVSPYLIYCKMEDYGEELKQFQFAQKGSNDYVFRLNPWNTFTKEKDLLADSKAYLGQDANISIEYVKEVPLLSSGKRKPVINEM